MAEYIGGSEEGFVNMMNERAKSLGMNNTHFVNACGLDADEHLTTALDIALMSREIINKYPEIINYSSIWMDSFTHITNRGESRFDLANTNKLLKQYDGCIGLKTGFTSAAGSCISAIVERNGIKLMCVLMGATDYKARTKDAIRLFDYGFSVCKLYTDEEQIDILIPVKNGIDEYVDYEYDKFSYAMVNGEITKKININEINAPVNIGDELGTITYFLNDIEIGSIKIKATENIEKYKYTDCLKDLFLNYLYKN